MECTHYAPENVYLGVLWLADVLLAQKQTVSDVGTHYAMCNPM